MPSSMQIEFVFADGQDPVASGHIHCTQAEVSEWFKAEDGKAFRITHRFQLPACAVFIECFFAGSTVYESALRVGVNTSERWDSVALGDFHTFVYRCTEFP